MRATFSPFAAGDDTMSRQRRAPLASKAHPYAIQPEGSVLLAHLQHKRHRTIRPECRPMDLSWRTLDEGRGAEEERLGARSREEGKQGCETACFKIYQVDRMAEKGKQPNADFNWMSRRRIAWDDVGIYSGRTDVDDGAPASSATTSSLRLQWTLPRKFGLNDSTIFFYSSVSMLGRLIATTRSKKMTLDCLRRLAVVRGKLSLYVPEEIDRH
jgi:hypothetical protein